MGSRHSNHGRKMRITLAHFTAEKNVKTRILRHVHSNGGLKTGATI